MLFSPLTRQQLASLTGLCVETVIRTIKQMKKDQIVKIEKKKIYY
ncbi:helix-turn-helix domain-containing protein [Chryseobacterium artocarpi]